MATFRDDDQAFEWSVTLSRLDFDFTVRDGVQIVITTHSPQLLDVLDLPEAILLVRRTDGGTKVLGESDPPACPRALDASGFGLGEWHETKGFGG